MGSQRRFLFLFVLALVVLLAIVQFQAGAFLPSSSSVSRFLGQNQPETPHSVHVRNAAFQDLQKVLPSSSEDNLEDLYPPLSSYRYQPSDIVMLVYSGKPFIETRLKASRDTWLTAFPHHYFLLGDFHPDLQPNLLLVYEHGSNDERSRNASHSKHFLGLKQAFDRHPDAKWFFFAGCDSYVLSDFLLRALHSYDSSQSVYVGAPLAGPEGLYSWQGESIPFALGGAGFALSNALVRQLYPQLETWYHQRWSGAWSMVDVAMAIMIWDVARVRLTPHDCLYLDHPVKYRMLGQMVCATPATFHYVFPDTMFFLHEYFTWRKMKALLQRERRQQQRATHKTDSELEQLLKNYASTTAQVLYRRTLENERREQYWQHAVEALRPEPSLSATPSAAASSPSSASASQVAHLCASGGATSASSMGRLFDLNLLDDPVLMPHLLQRVQSLSPHVSIFIMAESLYGSQRDSSSSSQALISTPAALPYELHRHWFADYWPKIRHVVAPDNCHLILPQQLFPISFLFSGGSRADSAEPSTARQEKARQAQRARCFMQQLTAVVSAVRDLKEEDVVMVSINGGLFQAADRGATVAELRREVASLATCPSLLAKLPLKGAANTMYWSARQLRKITDSGEVEEALMNWMMGQE
eukprot:TRINITY_DN11840_c0_g2_i1.p1 TRINITY_DN11840_c0_g2~~TRINITY_DN11840_c0_g2_i1.p1  ORF type:complete len:642 (-),score=100.84 TRINITY_DN11840_c0_g2_i1:196-2121(-)